MSFSVLNERPSICPLRTRLVFYWTQSGKNLDRLVRKVDPLRCHLISPQWGSTRHRSRLPPSTHRPAGVYHRHQDGQGQGGPLHRHVPQVGARRSQDCQGREARLTDKFRKLERDTIKINSLTIFFMTSFETFLSFFRFCCNFCFFFLFFIIFLLLFHDHCLSLCHFSRF